jgi:hypothetical protein
MRPLLRCFIPFSSANSTSLSSSDVSSVFQVEHSLGETTTHMTTSPTQLLPPSVESPRSQLQTIITMQFCPPVSHSGFSSELEKTCTSVSKRASTPTPAQTTTPRAEEVTVTSHRDAEPRVLGHRLIKTQVGTKSNSVHPLLLCRHSATLHDNMSFISVTGSAEEVFAGMAHYLS